jgi:hypothetical protein
MAASWFFNKQSDKNKSSDKTSKAAFAIRTMRDDLESIKNEESQNIPPITSSAPQAVKLSKDKKMVEKEEGREEKISQNPFGIASDNAPKQTSSYSSPAPYSTARNSMSASPIQPVIEDGLAPIEPLGGILINQESHRKIKWLIIFVVLLFFFTAGGLWYFFFGGKRLFNHTKEQVMEFLLLSDINVIENIPTINIPKIIEGNTVPTQKPFSSDKPNFLPFNTETVSSEDIRATFSQIATRLKETNITEPVEFLVTDQNNNPIAFNRFAFLLKLDVDPEVLSLAEEIFSLYAYNDAGTVRFGLVLDFKDTQTKTAADIIQKTESGLPYALRALIIEPGTTIGKKSAFQSSKYNQFDIRFTNIDISKNVAFDYTFYNNRFFIGTSKETLRAILNSVIQAEKK